MANLIAKLCDRCKPYVLFFFKPEQSQIKFDFHRVLRQVENRLPKLRDIKFSKHITFTFCCSHFRHTCLCWHFFSKSRSFAPFRGISVSSRKVVSDFNREKERKDRITANLKQSFSFRKKNLIFEKRDHFENSQKWPPGKRYSPCKIVTLGQKLKMQKNMLKTFPQHIAVVLCQKKAQKKSSYSKTETIFKIAKSGHQAKAFAKSSLWVKNAKCKKQHAKNVSITHCSCSMHKRARKNS